MKSIFSIFVPAIFAVAAIYFLRVAYIDGDYTGQSSAQYSREPYVGKADIKIERGKIVQVNFSIRDTSKNEVFDSTYEKYFIDNNEYIQQCRADWKGVQTYPAKLLETQNIDNVDAITGATWSYNIFKASVKDALAEASKQDGKGFLVK
jgi:major membrane immunogen (membrane-anchored lipoprotein)